jgi:hypothetical protein
MLPVASAFCPHFPPKQRFAGTSEMSAVGQVNKTADWIGSDLIWNNYGYRELIFRGNRVPVRAIRVLSL